MSSAFIRRSYHSRRGDPRSIIAPFLRGEQVRPRLQALPSTADLPTAAHPSPGAGWPSPEGAVAGAPLPELSVAGRHSAVRERWREGKEPGLRRLVLIQAKLQE